MLSPHRNLMLLAFFAFCSALASAQEAAPAAPTAVLATQGGVSITFADVDAFASRIPEDKRSGFFNSPARIEGVIINLLTQKQLAAEARKLGLDHDPEVTGEATPPTDEILARVRMERFKAAINVPDLTELAREKYQANKEAYVTPGKLTVKYVLISTTSRSADEAKAIADTVEKEAVAHPDQFDALIEKYSDDPNKATGHGILEQVGEPGKYVPEFVKAAKALTKAGEISPVVSTSNGLHVIQLVEHLADEQGSFDSVKGAIIEQLNTDFVNKAVKEHADDLRNQPMNADPALVASLRDRYGKVAPIPAAESKPTPLK